MVSYLEVLIFILAASHHAADRLPQVYHSSGLAKLREELEADSPTFYFLIYLQHKVIQG